MIETDEIVGIIKNRGHWRVTIRPEKFSSERLPFERCREILEKTQVGYRGYHFPELNRSELSNGQDYVQGILSAGIFHQFWRFYQSGNFYFLCSCYEDYHTKTGGMNILDILAAVYTMTEIYEFASRLALQNVFDDTINISIKLGNMKSRKLAILEFGRRLHQTYQLQINELERTEKCIATSLYGRTRDLAIEHLMWFIKRFGWDAPHVPALLKAHQDSIIKEQM